LKKLYLNNPTIISGMDVRPFMIPFSWEVLEQIDVANKDYDIKYIYINIYCNNVVSN
jgi:hypothetical protein